MAISESEIWDEADKFENTERSAQEPGMGLVVTTRIGLEEMQRQVDLMIDMADQNIGEFAELASNAEEEASAKDLANDLDAVLPLIKASPGLLSALRNLSTVVTKSDLAFCPENVDARIALAKVEKKS